MSKPPEPPKRGITEPPTGNVIKGPREGFIEDYDTNIQLLKRRLKTKDLEIVELTVGRYTQTRVGVVYISSIADKDVTDKVLQRIRDIDIDGIVDSYYITQFLQDENVKLFKQVGSDEKPDIITAKLLEGRVAIFVDGSPFVLTVPYIILEDIQQSNDYYSSSANVSLRRFIRIAGAFISIFLPGFYIAVQLYHSGIVPISMLITITNTLENTPFSPMLEVLFVLLLFEILFEASLHLPKSLGSTLGIVGALILGDTAIKSGLVSPPAVLVAAMSIITMYIITDLSPQVSLLRFFFALIGGILGLFGLIIGAVLLVVYLTGLDSFGAPYLAPYAPYIKEDTKDGLVKAPVNAMLTRPKSIPNINLVRAKRKNTGTHKPSGQSASKKAGDK